MSPVNPARRRGDEHAALVREAATMVGASKDPDVFDRAFRKVSRAHEADLARQKGRRVESPRGR